MNHREAKYKPAIKPNTEVSVDVDTAEPYFLVVYNDDFNTFDFVIDTLVEVCGHTRTQAEQCTLIIHYKGKSVVKEGDFKTLESMCNAITDRGISASVETVKI